MTNLLIRLFIGKDALTNEMSPIVRERFGRLAGGVAIAANILLFIAKITIGFISGSISIMADAVNNLSDCASGVITLVCFKLAGMPADEQHPYGHARFEYISGLIVSFFIIAVGIEFLISSVKKIINPQPVEFSIILVVVLVLSILVKLWLRHFNQTIGKRMDSAAILATADDSRNDVIATTAVLIGALLAHFAGWQLDGWMGVGIAIFILVSAIQLVRDTLSPLLGMAPDKELIEKIEKRILSYDTVIGLHDLMVHSYGPGRCFASVHIEFPAKQDILVSHEIIDRMELDFERNLDIAMVVHLDPIVEDDEEANRMRVHVEQIISEIDPALTMHDFRFIEGKKQTNLIFDVVVPPRLKESDNALRAVISEKIAQINADLHCIIRIDRSYTSTVNQGTL